MLFISNITAIWKHYKHKFIKPKMCVYIHFTYDIMAIWIYYQTKIIKQKTIICLSHMTLLQYGRKYVNKSLFMET